MDKDGCEPDPSALELHRRTSELIAAADVIGDRFLQYLYALALRHLEERPGCHGEPGRGKLAADPAIGEVARRLTALARFGGG